MVVVVLGMAENNWWTSFVLVVLEAAVWMASMSYGNFLFSVSIIKSTHQEQAT